MLVLVLVLDFSPFTLTHRKRLISVLQVNVAVRAFPPFPEVHSMLHPVGCPLSPSMGFGPPPPPLLQPGGLWDLTLHLHHLER